MSIKIGHEHNGTEWNGVNTYENTTKGAPITEGSPIKKITTWATASGFSHARIEVESVGGDKEGISAKEGLAEWMNKVTGRAAGSTRIIPLEVEAALARDFKSYIPLNPKDGQYHQSETSKPNKGFRWFDSSNGKTNENMASAADVARDFSQRPKEALETIALQIQRNQLSQVTTTHSAELT
jgi:hypothetical protein